MKGAWFAVVGDGLGRGGVRPEVWWLWYEGLGVLSILSELKLWSTFMSEWGWVGEMCTEVRSCDALNLEILSRPMPVVQVPDTPTWAKWEKCFMCGC